MVLAPRPRARPRARPRVRLTHRQVDTVSASTRLTRARWHQCDTNHSHAHPYKHKPYATRRVERAPTHNMVRGKDGAG